MNTNLNEQIAPRTFPVGTVFRLKAPYQQWTPGCLGVSFDQTDFLNKTGIFIIFEDGDCALFNALKIDEYFDVVGFSTVNCSYRYQGYSQLKMDFLTGEFRQAFELGRRLSAEALPV